MADEDEDIFNKSINDQYAARPQNTSNMCLTRFTVTYDTVYGSVCNAEKPAHENEDTAINSDCDEKSSKSKKWEVK